MENKKNVKGTTLVEVILSIALLSIIFIPFLGSVLSSVQNNVTSKEKIEAVAMAEKVIDEIKSRDVMEITIGEQPYSALTGTSALVPYYIIEEVNKWNVTPSGINTYSPDIGENADFVLSINQGTSAGVVDSVQLNGTTPFTSVNSAEDSFIFYLDYSSSGSVCSYFFGKNTTSGAISLIDFTPKDPDNIKLTVTYSNTSLPDKQLKIYTNIDSYYNTKFNIYVKDDQQSNSGVNFLNRSDIDFNVNYYDVTTSSAIAVNGLFKVTANIKKNGSIVYSQTTLVKK